MPHTMSPMLDETIRRPFSAWPQAEEVHEPWAPPTPDLPNWPNIQRLADRLRALKLAGMEATFRMHHWFSVKTDCGVFLHATSLRHRDAILAQALEIDPLAVACGCLGAQAQILFAKTPFERSLPVSQFSTHALGLDPDTANRWFKGAWAPGYGLSEITLDDAIAFLELVLATRNVHASLPSRPVVPSARTPRAAVHLEELATHEWHVVRPPELDVADPYVPAPHDPQPARSFWDRFRMSSRPAARAVRDNVPEQVPA